ncbi:MAG: hypothetical protein M3046_13715 [Actinomycetota bacterium]|nr:hypothetical protein [Actinomycetota bacterium]
MRGTGAGWSQRADKGRLTDEYMCPDCQTPEENAEAEINEATLDYRRGKIDARGRMTAPPKGSD